MYLKLFVYIALHNFVVSATTPCNLRHTDFGAVCVCTAEYCDYLDNPIPENDNSFVVVSSSKNGLRFSTTNGSFTKTEKFQVNDLNKNDFDPLMLIIESDGRGLLELAASASGRKFFTTSTNTRNTAKIRIDRKKQFQKIVGFGGAFTGSVSHILSQLDQSLQDQIYQTYYGKNGIQFNMLRMSIGGSDFDLQPWAYNELPIDDTALTNFTKLDQRDELKIEQIKRLSSKTGSSNLKIMAAAWSPPKWMKTNNEWTGYSFLKQQFYQTWADYHLRFLQLMATKNMLIWAISTGNEPLNGSWFGWFFVRFMSMGWTPKSQAIWLSEHLGPTIKKSEHKNVLIFGNDDQRYTYPEWFHSMGFTRMNALDYIDGLAVHWYWDDVFAPSLIDTTMRAMPGRLLINTESCVGDKPWETHGPELGSWERGEKYIRGFMQDFQHSFNGWIDWNLILNENGGPNYVNNNVDAPIIVNTTTREEFYKQPIFYAMGHFSKFLPPDSVRIDTKVSNMDIDAVGFQTSLGLIAVIIFNSAQVPMDVTLSDSVRGDFTINIPARSIHTFIYK